MPDCYGYIRVSTTKQGDGVSLEEQREAIERYAGKHDLDIVRWFEEQQTAAKQGRPVFNRMLKLLRGGEADGIVVHKIDRSSRNLKDWSELGDLIDEGIEVHFANEGFDLSSRGGRLSADIQAVVAADYIRNLRQEVKKGLYGRLKQGLYPLAAPVGYTDEGGGNPKEIDPIQGPLVRKAFELYATGNYSVDTLADEMKGRGLKNCADGKANRNSVWRMLKNPFYIGLMKVKGDIYEGVHEPIISKSLFDEVQNVLEGHAPKQRRKHDFLFRQLFECKHCGRSMIGEKQKGYVYYRCHTSDCPTKCFREDRLDQRVRDTLVSLEPNADEKQWLSQHLNELSNKWEDDRQEQLQTVELQLAQVDSRLDRLTDAFLDETIEENLFERKKTSLLEERTALKDTRRQIKSGDLSIPDRVKEILELAKTACLSYKAATTDQKRELLKTLTSNRTVDAENAFIELKKPFCWIAERPLIPLCRLNRDTTRTDGGIVEKIWKYVQEEITSA